MADGYISQIKTPDNKTYLLRDSEKTDEKVKQTSNSESKEFPIILKNTNNTTDETAGVKYAGGVSVNPSDKTVTATEFIGNIKANRVKPTIIKEWNDTSFYGANISGQDVHDLSTFWMLSVKPDSWYEPWIVRFKITTTCPAAANYYSVTYCMYSGRADGIVVFNWNERYDHAHYYTNVRTLKRAGFDAGLGHAIGINLYASNNYTNANYYRSFKLEYYDCDNCTVTILDNPIKWANWPNGTTTNYNGNNNANAVDRGLQESGDANSYDLLQMSNTYLKNGSFRFPGISLFGYDREGHAQPFSLYQSDYTSYTASISNKATRLYNTNGIDWTRGIHYNSSGGSWAGNADMNISIRLAQSAIDLRYTDNCVSTANTTLSMISRKPVYIRGTLDDNGLFYVAPLDVTYNNATYCRTWTQDIPTEVDNYVYWLIGYPYATSAYQINLYIENPLYWYHNGRFEEYKPASTITWADITNKPSTATSWPNWNQIQQNGANSIEEGTSDVTANTEILTSYASNNGFADTNGLGKVYRRDASKVVNATLVKAALGTNATHNNTFLRKDGTWATALVAHQTYNAFTGKPTGNQTPGFGDTFTIQQISQSTTGQVSGTDRTVKIPSITSNDIPVTLTRAQLINTEQMSFGSWLPKYSSGTAIPAKTMALFADGLAIKSPATANDAAWIRFVGTGEADSVLEIATSDDANNANAEKIVARQYNGTSAIYEAILLGKIGSVYGATSFPVQVEAPKFLKGTSIVPDTGNTTGSVGGTTTPVYVDAGVIKALSYTIAKSVPSDAKFTDTTYSAATNGGLSLSGTAFSIASSGVTNTMLAGSIENGKLTNSSLTVGNKSISLGNSGTVHDILKTSINIGTDTSWDQYDPGVYYVASSAAFTGTNNPENTNTNNGITPYRYGQLIVSRADTGGVAQFYISHNDSNSASYGIHYRTGWNNTYVAKWSVLLDSHNYINYAVAKTAGVTAVTWDSTNKKITKTINGTTSDVVTAATLKAAINVTAGDLGLSSALRYQGTTTTVMSDGLTTAKVQINNADFTPSAGDVVIYNDAEYLWTGSLWELIGAESSFKKVQTAVSSSSATGSSATTFVSSVTQDTQGVITVKTSTLNTSGTWSGKATTSGTADKIKDLTTTDKASSSNDWRRVWITYANKVEGRPAYTDDLVYQTSTNTLKTPHLLIEHVSGGQAEMHITYSTTIDYWWGVGTGNENHGLYDVKASKWILSAGSANTWSFAGNADTATTATNLSTAPSITSGGTATVTLSANTAYTLTVGGKSVVFKTPADNNTATATDDILDGSNSGTAITYKPYTTQQNKLSFDTSATDPTLTSRLNLNGYLYATKLYSGSNEVLTIQTKSKSLSSAGWYRILDCTAYSMAFFITFYGGYNNQPPTPVTFLISHAYNTTKIEQIGRSANVGWIQQLRAVHHDTSKFYIDVYYAGNKGNTGAFEITPLDPNARSNITLIDFTVITDSITANASCETTLESHADIADSASTATSAGKWTTARTFTIGSTSKSVDGSGNVSWSLADIGAAPTVTGGYLPLSGGTLTGAFTTANGTWNTMGDDAYFGDINKAGHIGIKGKNGNTGLFFTTYNQSSNTTGGAITWDGNKFSITSDTAIAGTITNAIQLSFKNGRIASADLDISTMRSRMLLTLASSSMTTNKPPMGDGYIVTYGWDNAYWGAQQAISHTKTPHMAIRGTNGGSTNDWGNWIYLLDANNYTDYTVTKTGTGASGTWGINITGSAGSVAWSNVSGRPTDVSSFTNDAGYLTSYTETDPTVPAWAKAASKPSYTASEVGALASSTVVTNVAISADTTTNKNYALVFGTTPSDGTSPTGAKTEGLQKNIAKLYVNPSTGNIQAETFNGYTLAAASAKSVVTSIDTGASLPTSNAVKTFVEGKGYVTSSDITTAINALDGTITGTPSNTNTITAFSQTNGKVSATFAAIDFPVTSVAGLTDAISASALTTALGLSSAMHYRGTSTTIPPTSGTYASGDVLVKTSTDEEYVYDGTNWRLLGSEGSYKIKQSNVADPTASTSTSTTFIDTISQDVEGVISATKKTLPTASTSVAGIIKIGHNATDAMAGDTNVTNVSFTAATDNNDYPVLMKDSTGSTTTAAGVKFASGDNQQVTINPSTGTVSTRRLVINNSSSNGTVPDLVFSRTSWSYINIPDNDAAVLAIGRGTGDNASQKLIIQGDGTVRPGSDNTQVLGKSTRRWKEVHGVNFYGTFNGTATYSQGLAKWAIANSNLNDFVSNGALRYSWEGGNNGIDSKPTGVNAFGVIAMKTATNWTGQLLMSTDSEPGLYWRTNLTTETPSYGSWTPLASGNGGIYYGTCSTAADVVEKVVVCKHYHTLKAGDIIVVTFTNSNTQAQPTLNVNNTGAVSVKMAYSGGIVDLGSTSQLRFTCTFIYDGTYWLIINQQNAIQLATSSGNVNWRSVLLSDSNSVSENFTPSANTLGRTYAAHNVKYQPSTGTLRAPIMKTPKVQIEYDHVNKAHIEWNDTDSSIDFIFD